MATKPTTTTTQPAQALAATEHRVVAIEGRFRSIGVEQLAMAWWLYSSNHITKRQLRAYFAAHEMAERRRWTQTKKGDRKPRYTITELARLVGSTGARAHRELAQEVRALGAIGLVTFSEDVIVFASSREALRIGDPIALRLACRSMPNNRRSVPVPRRMLRALAAGFSKGVTALVIAMLIRGLFWHKETNDYRVDGRTKLSWVAERFGISRRAATEARNHLIDIGWLEPIEVTQWEMNRWGLRDRINTEWVPRSVGQHRTEHLPARIDGASKSATPRLGDDIGSASPDQTESLSLKGDLKTRKLPSGDRAGVSPGSTWGGRKKKSNRRGGDCGESGGPPSLRDIQTEDFRDTGRLLELHEQAASLGLIDHSEHGRMTFLSLAERARSKGERPGALLYALLRDRRHSFITLHDEDEAARRLREHLNGPMVRQVIPAEQQWGGEEPRQLPEVEFSEDERVVVACIRAARQHRIADPFPIAQQVKGWTRELWNQALFEHQAAQVQRARSTLKEGVPDEQARSI